jgi:hypothetical protein
VVDRTNFYTHVEGAEQAATGDRKRFIGALAQVVVQRLIDAPTSTWVPLVGAIAAGFDNREAMVWSNQASVQDAIRQRSWEGSLPAAAGDFFDDSEFEYSAKNGSGLKRTYDHRVTVEPDGSGTMRTTLTIADTAPLSATNTDSLSYVTLYGPVGSHFVPGSTDTPYARESQLAGHPAAGWVRAAPPLGVATIQAEWEGPQVAVRQRDGTWVYRIRWMHLSGHVGDVLHLEVDLPPGWKWKGRSPPMIVNLDRDFQGSWVVQLPSQRGN